MTFAFLKMFIRNYRDTENATVRKNVGTMSGIVCIVLNVLLAAGKILVGALFGLISVLADGLNNLTDCGSNVVSLVSIKMANKPADSKHPYGHHRMEYIASMIVGFLVLVLAVELGIESVNKIIDLCKGISAVPKLNLWTIVALSASILVKLWMFAFNRILGKRYHSDLLKATSIDSISDVCGTSAVLVAVVVSNFVNFNLDGIMGVAVAIIILVAGIKILKVTIDQLLGEAPDDKMIGEIEARIKSFDGVCGIHDLNVHNYGPNKYYASVHVEVDASVDVMESHDLMDRIERDFAQNTDIALVTHLDPIVVGDPEVDAYKQQVVDIVHGLDEHFAVHDFRMVKGPTHTNLIFDVSIHFDTKMTDKQIADYIQAEIFKQDENVYVVPTVEQQIKADMPTRNKKIKK